MLAALFVGATIAKLLLDRGDANVSVADSKNFLALMRSTVWTWAESRNLEAFIVAGSANANATTSVSLGSGATVKLLLDDDDANVSVPDSSNFLALLQASNRGFKMIVKLV